MECIYCGKEQPKTITCEKKGAMFVCKNTNDVNVFAMPALFALAKRRGCIEYGVIYEDNSFGEFSLNRGQCLRISEVDCLSLYMDIPGHEEAWLVTPIKDGWHWEHVDPDIAFWTD